MEKLIKNIHLFILGFIAMTTYTLYTEFEEKSEALTTNLAAEQKRLEEKKKEFKAIDEYKRDIEKAKQNIEMVATQVEKLQRQLPTDVSNTENLEILSNIAQSLNIKNISLTPGAEEPRGFYIAKEYTLRGNGTYLQFTIFFERLAKVERLFNVKYLNLASPLLKQKGRFQMVDGEIRVESYKYNPNYKEDRGIEEIQKAEPTAVKKPRKKKKAEE